MTEQAATAAAAPIEADAVIIGAGPVGLFQAFELGLLEIHAHVIDALPHAGGQPIELYPDKPIYDIPALPVCTGRELVEALLKQVAPFSPTFHLGQTVTELQPQPDGRFALATRRGTRLLARTVIIAGGVGAFEPRTLKVAGIEAFEDTQLFYQVRDAGRFAGQHVVVQGDGDSALEWALQLAGDGPHRAASVTLVHRRDAFQAAPETVARMRARCAQGAMKFVAGQVTGFEASEGRMTGVQLMVGDGSSQVLPLDALLVLQGLSPKLGPVAQWGLAMERKQLVVDTASFSTSVRGIFAVGDINTYPGKRKLIACGFHECVLAAYGAAAIVFPEQGEIPLEYTTSSTRLHRLLGVGSPAKD